MNKRLAIRSGTGVALCITLAVLLIQSVAHHVPQLSIVVPASHTATSTDAQWYPVVKVVDGDTVRIRMNDKNVTVRLIGLNTPETVDPRRPVQCFGKEASDKAKQIMSGTSVRIETDSSQDAYDRYGRLLAYVYAPSNSNPAGILINEYMIAEGYGYEYTYDLPYKYQAEFKAAEKRARAEKKGLWAQGVCGN